MKEIIKSKTIETEYLGILIFITGGFAAIPWYFWIGNELKKNESPDTGKGAFIVASSISGVLIIGMLFAMAFAGGQNPVAATILNIMTLITLLAYFGWNELFRRKWNRIEMIRNHADFKAGPIWTILLGPIYLNFKVNQAKGLEK